MQTRWYPGGMLSFLSSPRVYNEFTQYRESIWGQIRHDGVVREVEIISIGKLGGERSPVWKVDFKTYELSQNAVDQKTKARILSVLSGIYCRNANSVTVLFPTPAFRAMLFSRNGFVRLMMHWNLRRLIVWTVAYCLHHCFGL